MKFDKAFGTVEGPLGLPCLEEQAKALDALLKTLPAEDREIHKAALPAAITTLEIGERADVSWISTEAVNRHGEIVLAKGMDDSHYKLNPLVTCGHAYDQPPVGTCLWWKQFKQGERKGVIAKTVYPPAPEVWPANQPWEPDMCLGLIQAGLLRAKSIGFLTLQKRAPSEKEIADDPALAKVSRIIEKWMLIEYAVCSIGVNQETVVQSVSKALNLQVTPSLAKALGLSQLEKSQGSELKARLDAIQFTPESAIRAAIARQLAGVNVEETAEKLALEVLDKRRGRVQDSPIGVRAFP